MKWNWNCNGFLISKCIQSKPIHPWFAIYSFRNNISYTFCAASAFIGLSLSSYNNVVSFHLLKKYKSKKLSFFVKIISEVILYINWAEPSVRANPECVSFSSYSLNHNYDNIMPTKCNQQWTFNTVRSSGRFSAFLILIVTTCLSSGHRFPISMWLNVLRGNTFHTVRSKCDIWIDFYYFPTSIYYESKNKKKSKICPSEWVRMNESTRNRKHMTEWKKTTFFFASFSVSLSTCSWPESPFN